MASSDKSANRQRLVEAVRAPIAYFALALLVIEVLLGLLASSGRLTPHAGEVMTYGMIGSLLLVLLGFLVALFSKPDILFRSGPADEAITSFRKLGDELTGHDFAILKRMLGSPAGYLADFASGIVAPGAETISDREKRLAKLGFIQKVGSSEVTLSPIGASYVHAIARHASEATGAAVNRLPPAVLPAGEVSATDADLASFLRALDLNTVARLMIIANTGQETVRMIVDELQRLRSEQTFERLVIQILLRAPSLTDERRAENAEQTIANAQRLDSRSASANAIVMEHRFYAGPVPLRCLLVEYASGKHAGFLSYYDWHQRVQRRATSTRDAASKRARIVYETDSHPALDSYLSWFSHFWGAHKLRAIVFDFDDTLFSTTEPQTSAWLLALRSSLEKELLQVSDLAPKLQAVWDRDHEARNFVRDSFFSQQSEDAIFAAIVPDESKRRRVFEFVRKERHKYRRIETMRDAQLVPNIAPSELARLSAEYVLVIVSATDEQLIDDVLKRWKLKEHFPYVVGREAPRQDWLDIETKSQNLIRVTHILGIPLERMVFIGDSHADYRSARQLGIRFIENRYNADIYRRASLIRDSNPVLHGILSRESTEGELTRLLEAIEASLS